MRKTLAGLFIVLIWVANTLSVYGQNTAIEERLGVGINLGGQRLFGDIQYPGVGIASEVYLNFLIDERFFLTASLGYGELNGEIDYDLINYKFTTNLVTADLKGAFRILPSGPFQPYVFLGLGIHNFQYENENRYSDGSFFYGGGFEFMINPFLALNAFMDYRFTTGDDLDGMPQGKRDGYLNGRGGITYYFKERSMVREAKILAEQKTPVEEMTEESAFDTSYGQGIEERLGVGINLGGQRLFGDIQYPGVGIALEAYLNFLIDERFFLTASLGYGEINDGFMDNTFTTNLLTADLKGAFRILPWGPFQPYVFLGLGIHNFKYPDYKRRYFDGSFFYGGGFEFIINPFLALNAFMDYRFTTGDDLDGIYRGKRDGYLNGRGGVTYYFKERSMVREAKILAEQKAPVEEVGGEVDLDSFAKGIDEYEQASEADFTMEQYIKLKSRVDQLNDAIRQKEMEIEELKAQLNIRKEKIAELENELRQRGGVLAQSLDMDLTDFSASYERALEQFYSKEYDAAIYAFGMLLEAYPTHSLASNCQYWIGECYFGSYNYVSALEAFRKVLDFNRSFKKDDALLMLGRCYLKMGNPEMAKEMFERLLSEYPDSEYADKAEQYLSRF